MTFKPSPIALEAPQLVKENGELSLHFNFPTIQSRMRISDPERLVLDYTRTMMGFLLFNPKPSRIAMVGLGGGSLAKYCYYRLPAADFTAIEISPEVVKLRRDFGIPDDNDRFHIVCGDGANFVRERTELYDVLLIDGFDSEGQPEQLCSIEFYDHCYSTLRSEGVLVVNLCADDSACSSYLSRIGTVFSGKVICIDADEGENKIVFAGKNNVFPPSFSELTERLRALEAKHAIELDLTAQKIMRRGHIGNSRQRRR